MITSKILLDSINPYGARLCTFQLTYPRCIHGEFMTHRTFSRNAASSRAIPIEKTIREVETNPFIPMVWGKNQSGMQAENIITDPEEIKKCEAEWLLAASNSIESAKRLNNLGLHKQIVNRVLEPFTFITVVATTCEPGLKNFFRLRSHKDAEPHIRKLSDLMQEVYWGNQPKELDYGEWHLPLTGFEGDEELSIEDLIKVSVGRCARVSYKTHDGKRDVQKDIDLYNRLSSSKHWSPFEHVAQSNKEKFYRFFLNRSLRGNLGKGWIQLRKTFIDEF